MYDLLKNSTNITKVTTAVRSQPSTHRFANGKMQRGTSLDHILQEITNFGVLEAETEASIIGLKGLDKISKRAKSVEVLADGDEKEPLRKNKRLFHTTTIDTRFKDMLVNENVVIIEKSPPETPPQRPSPEEDVTCYNKVPARCERECSVASDMPVPNTVRRYKNIFETLSGNSRSPSHQKSKTSVSRSISVRVTTADWKQAKPEYQEIISKLEALSVDQEDRRRTLPGRLVIPQEIVATPPPATVDCVEVEEARDWLNACSPVSPDVIQKLRERGTSVTFFGRSPSNTPSPSPTTDSVDSDWSLRKPRIVGITPKIQANSPANKPPSSLESSSTCSDDELHFSTNFDFASPDGDYQRPNTSNNEEDSGQDEDYYSYDVVFLNGAYPRSNLPHSILKGVWLRDPFWIGSSYIVFDFRGTNVKPHIRS